MDKAGLTSLLTEGSSPTGTLAATGRIVALVGGGGKTTLLYALAKALLMQKIPVLCTTTTRLFPPLPTEARLMVCSPCDLTAAVAPSAEGTLPVVLAQRFVPDGKVQGFTPESLRPLCEQIREKGGVLLIEADGAARRPLKAPAAHEPAVPAEVTCCIAVLGLDCVGAPLDDGHVHRAALVCLRTGQDAGTPVTAQTLARMAASPEGFFRSVPEGCRRVVLCNKAEHPESVAEARMAMRWFSTMREALPCTWYAGSAAQGWCVRLGQGLAASPPVL